MELCLTSINDALHFEVGEEISEIKTSKETIVFGTNQYSMLVLYWCDKVVWIREEFIREHREERRWKDNSRIE